MTKQKLAEKILEHIESCEFLGAGKKYKIEGIVNYLDTLEPKDLNQFAQWGYDEEISTPEECWI